jgi:hypothetical protein
VIGFAVEVNPPGPVHEYVNGPTPPDGVAVKGAEPAEAQIVGLFTVTVGLAFRVKVPDPLAVQSFASVTVTV